MLATLLPLLMLAPVGNAAPTAAAGSCWQMLLPLMLAAAVLEIFGLPVAASDNALLCVIQPYGPAAVCCSYIHTKNNRAICGQHPKTKSISATHTKNNSIDHHTKNKSISTPRTKNKSISIPTSKRSQIRCTIQKESQFRRHHSNQVSSIPTLKSSPLRRPGTKTNTISIQPPNPIFSDPHEKTKSFLILTLKSNQVQSPTL